MSEVRRLNDARRGRFCRPGAERDDLVICDLGTPWCSVDHDEDMELVLLDAAAAGDPGAMLDVLLFELERRNCVVAFIERQATRWEVRYCDRWGQRGMTHVDIPAACASPKFPGVVFTDIVRALTKPQPTHCDQLEKEPSKFQEFSGADLMAALSIVGFVMAAMISIVWVASLL